MFKKSNDLLVTICIISPIYNKKEYTQTACLFKIDKLINTNLWTYSHVKTKGIMQKKIDYIILYHGIAYDSRIVAVNNQMEKKLENS